MSIQDGQSSFQLTSDRDYRRGVILGLTLAEVLLLLVFLLLLAAGSILTHAHEDAARQAARVDDLASRLAPVIAALTRAGFPVGNIDDLSTLLRQGQEAAALRKTVDDLIPTPLASDSRWGFPDAAMM